jgi:hypothetical protein
MMTNPRTDEPHRLHGLDGDPLPSEAWLREVGIYMSEWRGLALLTIHRELVMEILASLRDQPGQSKTALAWAENESERELRRALVRHLGERELIRWERGPAEYPSSAPASVRRRYPADYARLTSAGSALLVAVKESTP